MNNADTPAMPLSGDACQYFASYDETKNTGYNPECQGLTKREYFAGLAMQGLLANQFNPSISADACDSYAIEYADALLKQLEEDK